jgi:ornithine cyclodeaminase
MPTIRILTETDLRGQVTLDLALVDLIEQAFAALATKQVVMPPILSMEIRERHGEVDVKTAYVPGLDGFAIKISPGFFDNPKLGLPSLNGLMVLLSAETGIVQAVLLDNGYLTDIRTAAAGAVAARHLAPSRVHTAAVLGAGVQAELQMQALALVRPFEELLVWARDPDKAAAYAARMAPRLGRSVRTVPTAEAAVADAQVVVTTTPSREPVLRAEWLHPGLHVTAMGSDAAGKNELEPAVLAQADLLVCDRVGQCSRLGELRSAIAAGLLSADHRPPELGEVIAGLEPGRSSDEQITVADLTGTGIQDTAVATAAFARCRRAGVGSEIEA